MEKRYKQHKYVIDNFLKFLNKENDDFVLKGGTALMECYKLDRFSEDIDLDGLRHVLPSIVSDFCKKYQYECRTAKDIETVQRCFIHYGGIKPLKIETSYRKKEISEEETTVINGIKVYTIQSLALQKCNAYTTRDKIRDLYDITFICNNYFEQLSNVHKQILQNAIQYKGIEQFDFLVATLTEDELIDVDKLADDFLKAYDKLGLLYDDFCEEEER